MTELRIALLITGLLLIMAVWYFSRSPQQGNQPHHRRAPSLDPQSSPPAAPGEQAELDFPNEPAAPPGQRPEQEYDKIVTLHVAAKPGHTLRGPNIVVAAEKTGLIYGHLDIYHRLPVGVSDRGPIFSVANLQPPNSFPMTEIQKLETPALVFFITLPAPVAALDAWEVMLPCAQRMAELLDAVVLDERHNTLTRQRIAGIRDELRAWDRQQTGI